MTDYQLEFGIPRGPQGPQGPTGATGPAGATGPQGPAPVFGTPQTGEPDTSVQMSGTGTQADPFILTIPKGADGSSATQELTGEVAPAQAFGLAVNGDVIVLEYPEPLQSFSIESGSSQTSYYTFPTPTLHTVNISYDFNKNTTWGGMNSNYVSETINRAQSQLAQVTSYTQALKWAGTVLATAGQSESVNVTTSPSYTQGSSETTGSGGYCYHNDAGLTLTPQSKTVSGFSFLTGLTPNTSRTFALTYRLFLPYCYSDLYCCISDAAGRWPSSYATMSMYTRDVTVNVTGTVGSDGTVTLPQHTVTFTAWSHRRSSGATGLNTAYVGVRGNSSRTGTITAYAVLSQLRTV